MVGIIKLFFSGGPFAAWFLISYNHFVPLETGTNSMRNSYPELSNLIKNCNGVISLEPLFIGAFLNILLNSVFSIWEIPSFGNLKKSEYDSFGPKELIALLFQII